MTIKVAFVGKGGVGKSAIAGTFARALARHGEPVLAIDSDPLPGLAFSLGLARSDAPLPDDAVDEKAEGEEGPRYRLRAGLSAAEAVESYATTGPDGVRFLQFGNIRGSGNNLWKPQMAFLQVVRALPPHRWNVVGDLPGGTRQAFTGWGHFADLIVVVVEPTAKSLLSGRRLARMAHTRDEGPAPRVVAVASKVREPADAEAVGRGTGLAVVGSVPWDEDLAEAERRALAPLDHAPQCPAVRAVESLVDVLCEERVA